MTASYNFPSRLFPDSYEDFKTLLERRAPSLRLVCTKCAAPFSSINTHTPESWRDTQIIGWCEDCYDRLLFPNGPLGPEAPTAEGGPHAEA
jgi:hypothetical protein